MYIYKHKFCVHFDWGRRGASSDITPLDIDIIQYRSRKINETNERYNFPLRKKNKNQLEEQRKKITRSI